MILQISEGGPLFILIYEDILKLQMRVSRGSEMKNLQESYVKKVPPSIRVLISISVFFVAYIITRAVVK